MEHAPLWDGLSYQTRTNLLNALMNVPRPRARELAIRSWEALPQWARRGLKHFDQYPDRSLPEHLRNLSLASWHEHKSQMQPVQ